MEEVILKSSDAAYFKSATKMFTGQLVLTNRRILFNGEHARLKFDHGAIGNILRDKMEKAMGYDEAEQFVFEMQIGEAKHELRRFGFSKRLILHDPQGQKYNIQINSKKERNGWPDAIDHAKTL